MRHNCPYCKQSIKWRLVRSKPLPGERKVFPKQAVAVCPVCGGELAANTHWSEHMAGAIVAIPLLVFTNIRSGITITLAAWLGAGVLAFWAAAFAFFHFRYWRNWQRYKKYVPPRR